MAQRKSVYVEGYNHKNPLPPASRIGNMVFTGLISGSDPKTKKQPPTLEEQVVNMFGHVRAIVVAAGGTPEHIVKMDLWMKDRTRRDAVNTEWVKMFPDEASRPTRHTHAADLEGDKQVECTFVAVID
jgi:2-iminobutanoate/2-iminopropanoate deaminase